MGTDTGRHSQIVAASRERIRQVLLDFPSYPGWQTGVSQCRVLEAGQQHWLVETVVDIKLSQVRYVARYHLEDADSLRWDYVRGDLKDLRGRYTLAAQDAGTTLVTVDIAFELGFYLPGPIKSAIRDQSVASSLRGLKRAAEAPSGP